MNLNENFSQCMLEKADCMHENSLCIYYKYSLLAAL